MKRLFYILSSLLLAACVSFSENPYTDDLQTLEVQAVYPPDYAEYLRAGVSVTVKEVSSGNKYTAQTNDGGIVEFRLANGIYRITISDQASETAMFNGSADRVQVINGDRKMPVNLRYSKPGKLIFKEIYCGGCSKAPEQGTYNVDQYVILHNNHAATLYLDGLCFGSLDPYNSNSANNVWVTKDPVTGETVFPAFVPLIQAIWEFGGSGKEFPLEPGADAVISITGAINHAAAYPLSVNLNKPDYFVCYNSLYFSNVTNHPTPGDQIQLSHHLNVAIKLGQSNAYTYSQTSPASVIFRPEGMTLQEFLDVPSNVVQKPGSAVDKCALVPQEWIIDGAEVFTTASDPTKRLQPSIDAGFVVLSNTKKGHTLHRKLNEEATEAAGFDIYMDTNNSSNDFYERETQSLHE